MKRLSGITFALTLSVGITQIQAEGSLLTTLKNCAQKPWAQKTMHIGCQILNAGKTWVHNNPKKSIALGAIVGTYCLYKGGSYIKKQRATKEEKIFGYNPKFSTFPTKQNKKKATLIISHGFGDNKENNENWSEFYKYYDLTTINFNFPDDTSEPRNTFETFFAFFKDLSVIRRINLGGLPDAEPLVYAIKQCADAEKDIILHGHSRGGAAIITALHMLTFPEQDNYKNSWKKLGLLDKNGQPDYEQIKNIRGQIKKIFFVNPLMDVTSVFKNICTPSKTDKQKKEEEKNKKEENDMLESISKACATFKDKNNDDYNDSETDKLLFQTEKEINKSEDEQPNVLEKIYNFIRQVIIPRSGMSTSKVALGAFTNWKMFSKQPIDLLREIYTHDHDIKNKSFLDLYFSFAEKDEIVTNEHDHTIEELAKETNHRWCINNVKGQAHCDFEPSKTEMRSYLETHYKHKIIIEEDYCSTDQNNDHCTQKHQPTLDIQLNINDDDDNKNNSDSTDQNNPNDTPPMINIYDNTSANSGENNQ
jgi:hypothetical protein